MGLEGVPVPTGWDAIAPGPAKDELRAECDVNRELRRSLHALAEQIASIRTTDDLRVAKRHAQRVLEADECTQ